MKLTTKFVLVTFITMMPVVTMLGCKQSLVDDIELSEDTSAYETTDEGRYIYMNSDNESCGDGGLGAHGTGKHGGHGGNGRGSRGGNHGSSKNN